MRLRRVLLFVVCLGLTACGGTPLQSIGLRSSEWINEPTVPTTLAVATTSPTVVSVNRLLWANDTIETAADLDDRDAVLGEVFSRREGDRFVQASRFEIAAVLPDLAFPGRAPNAAGWVSSQLVFDNDGSIATDTSAAFGIWSAEPYTRSRSVAQMIILRVIIDPETAETITSGDQDVSCALFSDRNTDQCEIITVGNQEIWHLKGSSGSTLVWFDAAYRYELFGRSFVPLRVLQGMSSHMVPLASIAREAS